MRPAPPRTATLLLVCALPSAALVFVLAALAQPALWATAALAGAVAIGAWLAELRRRMADLPRPVGRSARS